MDSIFYNPPMMCWFLIIVLSIKIQLIIGDNQTERRNFAFNKDFNVLDFAVDDIFDGHLMSTQLLLLPTEDYRISKWKNPPMSSKIHLGGDLDINLALETMMFHRRMMNKFMASNYVTQEILSKIGKNNTMLIGKRFGTIKNATNNGIKKDRQTDVGSVQKFLYDDGSERYKAWLQKTTTLDDILNQLKQKSQSEVKEKVNSVANRRQININTDTSMTGSGSEDDFDEGDITGYALNSSPDRSIYPYAEQQDRWPLLATTANPQLRASHMQAFNKNGYESVHEEYGVPPHMVHSHAPEHSTKPTREIGLKDITDIALTTLAFLSFGMFILQVLMCITMGKDDSNNLMMLPMEATGPSAIPEEIGPDEIRRRRRSIFAPSKLQKIDELSKQILKSIDAVILTADKDDNSKALYKTICENNRFARTQSFGQKFWIPIWSLGISWLSSRMKSSTDGSTGYESILKSMKAMTTGLQKNGHCSYV